MGEHELSGDGEEVVHQVENDRRAQAVDTEEAPRLPFPVVAVGASAGGLEAFIELFDAMPADCGMAFVLIQHLPPDRDSHVAEIISKHCQLPVQQVEDGIQIEPNMVYVIRPGRTLTVKNGILHLGETVESRGHTRPVDDFFRSLAEEQRQRSICIVLSGMGSNGSAGAEVVKAVGGLVIAQDPESAKFPAMPRHLIDSGNADYVLRPSELPGFLIRYTNHPYVKEDRAGDAAAERDAQHLGEVVSVLRARTRRDFAGYKKPTVLRRIQRRMGLNHIADLASYAKYLRQNPAEVTALADDLMIHVTGFFRDPEAWESLAKHVLVPLVQERETNSDIRCWVTACSTGEEAYTLGMLLSEAADAAGKSFDIKVFATDMADRTLARARAGIYPGGIEGEISPARLDRFFDKDDAVYRVKKELREMVVFAPQNVVQDPPFSRLDICTCRNLLIYLEPELQRRVLSLLHFGLRDGGVLFLGTSETISGAEQLFEPIDKRAHIYRRVGPPSRETLEFAFSRALIPSAEHDPRLALSAGKISIGQITNRVLLDKYTPTAVTVDRSFGVVYYHGDTSRYLRHPSGEPTRDLLMLVHDSLRGAVRSALHKASAEGVVATSIDGMIDTEEGRFRLEVTVAPLEPKLASGHYLVTFHHRPESQPEEFVAANIDADNATTLRGELHRVQEELQSTIEELQSSNEELRASNEEAMSINEELQSTNEELQTSKEELQSLNEELTTVNAQLQAKMEEHEATSSDLASLLSSTDIAVIFLDSKLRIRRYTPATLDLFELIATDVGRPMSDLATKFTDPNLISDCRTVLDRLVPVEKHVCSNSGRVYIRRVLPYRTADDRIGGVVLTFIDITELSQIEDALRSSEERFRLVLEGAPDFAMMLMDASGQIQVWNSGAERLTGWSAMEAIGKSGALVYPPESSQEQFGHEMQRAAELGRALDETWHVRKAGSRFWGSGVLTAIHNADGQLTGFVKVLRDETARKQGEAQKAELLERERIARAEAENATRLKDQFLATLSHELRTPISAVLMWSKMLRQNLCDDTERQQGLEVIERSAEAQAQLLDDLLDTSRIAAGKVHLHRTEIDFKHIVELAVEGVLLLARTKGVELHTEFNNDIGSLYADPDRLRQVIGNLLTNAVKFTPEGGHVHVRAQKTSGYIELAVSDTGQGIEPEFMPGIFTAFSQADSSKSRSFGGLGLGLAIAKELVELHGGTIHAESAGEGQGAVFIVRLPLFNVAHDGAKKNAKKTAIEIGQQSLGGARVLLVEDDLQTREALVKVLQKSDARVIAVESAATAIDALANGWPDVIVSDIGMQDEDGYQLMHRIRSLEVEQKRPAAPAIALTAFASNKDRRQARDAGFDKHVAKPVTPAALLAAIMTLLKDKQKVEESTND